MAITTEYKDLYVEDSTRMGVGMIGPRDLIKMDKGAPSGTHAATAPMPHPPLPAPTMINVGGATAEQVREMRRAVWEILLSDISDELKLSAMNIFKTMVKAPDTLHIEGCTFHK